MQEKVITTGRVLRVCLLDCSEYLWKLFCSVILNSKETEETWVEISEKQIQIYFVCFEFLVADVNIFL